MFSILLKIVFAACNTFVICSLLGVIFGAAPATAFAQQFSQKQGSALGVDLIRTAQTVSMQDMYSRAIYLHIRSNPAVLDNPQFYVNFLIFLMTKDGEFNCREAFANEFERRDFFTRSFGLKDQIRQVVNSVTIPSRFEIAYSIDTGRYEFTSGKLPFQGFRPVSTSQGLSQSITSSSEQNCAQQILSGTTVEVGQFPWHFQVVNESGERGQPGFPFGQELVLPDSDARMLFSQFGRQLYAIISYQFQAANNGEAKVQIIPADGQLFGLSSDAVVRVKTFQHPRLSQPSFLDMTNPMTVLVDDLDLNAKLEFQQQGFRAVGTGTREDPGTDITLGGTVPVSGSAAVGNSLFVMRLATPRLMNRVPGLDQMQPGSQRFLTLIGAVDFEKVRPNLAPVSGQAIVLQLEQSGEMHEAYGMHFTGAFRPAAKPATEPAPEVAPAASTEVTND